MAGPLKPLGIRAKQKGLDLGVRIAADVPDHFIGDPMRLRQILIILTDNAIKFTERGKVVVAIAGEVDSDGGASLRFSIADTGIGIPAEKQRAIFGAFAQADSSTTRTYGGTGLGLAIASQLVGLMRGKIWVESTQGQGTTFHFTVRLGAGEASRLPIAVGSGDASRCLEASTPASDRIDAGKLPRAGPFRARFAQLLRRVRRVTRPSSRPATRSTRAAGKLDRREFALRRPRTGVGPNFGRVGRDDPPVRVTRSDDGSDQTALFFRRLAAAWPLLPVDPSNAFLPRYPVIRCRLNPVPSLHDLPFPALERTLVTAGLRPIHARPLWRALYRDLVRGADDLAGRTDFPPPLQRWAESNLRPGSDDESAFTFDQPLAAADLASTDGLTRKFLLRLADGQTVETVLMAYPGRHTACLSTQAGCAMGCVFCATGQMGFVRHLRPGEIVAQVLHAQRALRAAGQPGLRNLVLMGMGEPLHNYANLMTALEIITDTRGLNLGPGRISISTVGVVPGILRLAEEERPYNLAVSLHGASEQERAALVPASRRWPLALLIDACRIYGEKTGRRIFFEWTLIAGTNDSPDVARRLAALLAGLDAHVNLIPLNPTTGFAGVATKTEAADRFQQVLQDAGFPCTIRQRRGIDVAAGCGQLRAEKIVRQALAAT